MNQNKIMRLFHKSIFVLAMAWVMLSFGFSSGAAEIKNDWKQSEAKLNALNAKVNSKKDELEKIIEEKKQTADKETLHDLMEKLAKTHREMLEKDSELRDLKNHIRFFHPEHGLDLDRNYTPLRPVDMDKFDTELGIDGKLNRVKQTVHEVYGKDAPAPVEELESENDPGPRGAKSTDEAKKAPIKPNRSIIKPEPAPERIKLSQ